MGYAATSTLFGFEFQANAAIVLMLEHIKEMDEIRLEGDEDIDITLSDKSKILAQAKAVERPYDDFANVTTKLKEALTSLSSSYNENNNVRNVIYITTSLGTIKQIFACFKKSRCTKFRTCRKSSFF